MNLITRIEYEIKNINHGQTLLTIKCDLASTIYIPLLVKSEKAIRNYIADMNRIYLIIKKCGGSSLGKQLVLNCEIDSLNVFDGISALISRCRRAQ